MSDYFDLGSYTRSVTTTSPEAQMWFDRGLNWSYAFHRDEALECFAKVVEIDGECAMGHWGLAYSSGPYYNGPWERIPVRQRPGVVEKAHSHIQRAREVSSGCTDVEVALIEALFERIPEPACDDMATFDRWDDAYAQAMSAVHARFSEDDDVCALATDALICRTPWKLWDLEQRVPAAGSSTKEAIEIVEQAFRRRETSEGTHHPGLLHFFIHMMEMSPEPEKALEASDILRGLAPDAAHLVHMPSHIYILCGEFEKSLSSNVEATAADDKYVAFNDAVGMYTLYRLHNIHFQIYSAMFLGKFEPAMAAADLICETVTPDVLGHENEFLVNYLEAFYGMKVHVLIRFGRWQEIIEAPMPQNPELFLVTTALWHYAKGVAYSASGDVENALVEQERFLDAFERVPHERMIFNNESREMLKVGEAMLAGELEYRREDYETAFGHLRRCVELYDKLNYSEPWGWMQPPRHALGALLLEQGQVEESAAVYRADLGLDDTLVRPSQHPGNIWSLHGYLECCRLLGRTEEGDAIEKELAAATSLTDVAVTSSCFCRQPDSCCD